MLAKNAVVVAEDVDARSCYICGNPDFFACACTPEDWDDTGLVFEGIKYVA